ncbi:B2 bradykinin receptor [Chanos chanos]|uniref:B1 bradykinin receptor n=1 Tax=Chanos chanos TaxID=29144 RepID=A0A6J2V625_CHACN|nr:B2 bradykinin receptor-like [Chanos chanos]
MAPNSTEEGSSTLDSYLDVDNCSYTTAWLWLSTLQPTYILLVSMVGVAGNGFVLAVFCLQRKFCSVADVYLGNLAAADLAMVACLPFWAVTIARDYSWTYGVPLCKLVNVVISMNYYCSIMFLVLVSVDRYLALVRPMHPSRLRRVVWAKRACWSVWVLAFLFSIPTLIFRSVSYIPDLDVQACFLVFPHVGWKVPRNLTIIVLGYLVPLPVLVFCTYHMVKALGGRHRAGELPGVRREKRATVLVLIVMAVFVICWTPYHVYRLLDTLDYFEVLPGCLWGHVLDVVEQVSSYFAYGNSSMNPFLYVIVGKHFRKRVKGAFRRVLGMDWKQGNITTVSKLPESRKGSRENEIRILPRGQSDA